MVRVSPENRDRGKKIGDVLMEGPASTTEIALELGISMRSAHIGLWVLRKRGEVEVQGTVPNAGRKPVNLYRMTVRGESMYRARSRRQWKPKKGQPDDGVSEASEKGVREGDVRGCSGRGAG